MGEPFWCSLGFHNWGDWTPVDSCTTRRICSACRWQDHRISHDVGAWERVAAEGCEAVGTCKRCGHREPGMLHDGLWILDDQVQTDYENPGIHCYVYESRLCPRCGRTDYGEDQVGTDEFDAWTKWCGNPQNWEPSVEPHLPWPRPDPRPAMADEDAANGDAMTPRPATTYEDVATGDVMTDARTALYWLFGVAVMVVLLGKCSSL